MTHKIAKYEPTWGYYLDVILPCIIEKYPGYIDKTLEEVGQLSLPSKDRNTKNSELCFFANVLDAKLWSLSCDRNITLRMAILKIKTYKGHCNVEEQSYLDTYLKEFYEFIIYQ